MASFQKRGKTWQYTISRMVNGKSKPIRKGGFRTKKEAQIAAAEVESQLRKGLAPHLKDEPFDEYFLSWLKTYKTDVTKNTLERYNVTYKAILKYFKGKPIQSITKRDYQAFLNDYSKGRAKASVRKLNTHIRACVRDAIDEGIISTDFTRKATISGNAAKSASEKHLNYFESKRLLKEVYNRLDRGLVYYLILLGLTTGLRFGELVGLQRKDFDFQKNRIRVNKVWGYNNKMPPGFGPTKNEQSARVISVDKRTMNTFQDLFGRMTENTYQLVFFSPRSKYRVISNTGVNKILANLLRELNLPIITFHGLRHTHASILLYKRVSIYYISERLGHKDIQTTLETYAHVIKELRVEDEKNSASVFEKMLV